MGYAYVSRMDSLEAEAIEHMVNLEEQREALAKQIREHVWVALHL